MLSKQICFLSQEQKKVVLLREWISKDELSYIGDETLMGRGQSTSGALWGLSFRWHRFGVADTGQQCLCLVNLYGMFFVWDLSWLTKGKVLKH